MHPTQRNSLNQILVSVALIAITFSVASCQRFSANTTEVIEFTVTEESVKLTSANRLDLPMWIGIGHFPMPFAMDTITSVQSETIGFGELIEGELKFTTPLPEPTGIVFCLWIGKDVKEITDLYKTEPPEPGVTITIPVQPTICSSAFVNSNSTTKLALLMNESYDFYQVLQQGSSHGSIDPYRKFSFSGDLSNLVDFDLNKTSITLIRNNSYFFENSYGRQFEPILLDDGKFSIERDLDEPSVFTIEFAQQLSQWMTRFQITHAIFEPGVSYKLVPLGNKGQLAVRANQDSVHTKLVSSWQFDPTYISLVDQWVEQRSKTDPLITITPPDRYEEFIDRYEVADECVHVKLTESILSDLHYLSFDEQSTVSDELLIKRYGLLREILRETEDPELARMLVELNSAVNEYDVISSVYEAEEQVALLLELEAKVDKEFIENYLRPKVEGHENNEILERKNKSLLPGQLAPKFTLSTVDTGEVSLDEVLDLNKLVLVDFWASWCGPCIATFPALKELYSTYKNQGFEIITISLDETLIDWYDESQNLNLPWIDLGVWENGSMQGRLAPITFDYGVNWLPKPFLIDEHGCIIRKDFSPEDLQKILSQND